VNLRGVLVMPGYRVQFGATGLNNLLRNILWLVPLASLLMLIGGKCAFFGPDRNVIIITIDTLRADRLGCYGSETVDTPNIDALAERGVLCEEAITPAPLTLPGHASILTGRYPIEHGARDNTFYRLPQGYPTLSGRLTEEGYHTAAFVASATLNARFGLDQGFDMYQDLTPPGGKAPIMYDAEIKADRVNRKVFEWLDDDVEQPFFLWVHYFDPHYPYKPPRKFSEKYKSQPYDGEVAFADEQVGKLLRRLDKRGLRNNTLIVLTSDHGEALGEHGEKTHGLFLYRPTMRAPLIFSGPGIPEGRRIKSMVGLVDIAPTVLDYLGIKKDVFECGGGSLMAAINGREKLNEKPVYIETIAPQTLGWSSLKGLRTADYKYIAPPGKEMYNITEDPGEKVNLYTEDEELAADLSRRMKKFVAKLSPLDDPGAAEFIPDEKVRKSVESLGYVGQRAPRRKSRENPMDMKEVLEYYQMGNIFSQKSLWSLAITEYEKALELDPDNPAALRKMAFALFREGKYDAAREKFEKLTRIAPQVPMVWKNLGVVYRFMEKYDKAADCARKALELDPNTREAHYMLGMAAQERGDIQAAVEHYREELEISPHHSFAMKALGEILASKPETSEEGKKLLKKAGRIERQRQPSR